MSNYVVPLIFVLITLALMFVLMRRGQLKERYATWWIIVGVSVIVVLIFPPFLPWATALLGFEVSSNLVFFVAILLFLLISVQFSVDLSRLVDDNRRLAEEIAILRTEIESNPGAAAKNDATDNE